MDKKKYFYSGKIKGQVQQAIAPATAAALTSFCEQEPEFEQAIEQSGKNFQDCLDNVAKGVGKSISDLDAFSKAAKFYFSTATVSFVMNINLSGDSSTPPITMTKNEPKKDTLSVSLDDLLDF